jgi:hypothetical protein
MGRVNLAKPSIWVWTFGKLVFDSNRKSVATSPQAVATTFKPERRQKTLLDTLISMGP